MKHLSALFLLFFFGLVLRSAPAAAQISFDERYTLSTGFTAFMDFTQGPAFTNRDTTQVLYGSGLSLLSYTINPRINFWELSDNAAFSLEAPLSLSVRLSNLGLGSVNVPVLLSYNYGTVATHHSEKERGFTAGIGLEFNQIGLLKFPPPDHVSPRYRWVQPVLVAGYRYRGKRYKAKEINLKVGYGVSDEVPLKQADVRLQTVTNILERYPTLTVKLSFVRYIHD